MMTEPKGKILDQEIDDYLNQRYPDPAAYDPEPPVLATILPAERKPRKVKAKKPKKATGKPKSRKKTTKKAKARSAPKATPRKKKTAARAKRPRARSRAKKGARKGAKRRRQPAKKKSKKHHASAPSASPTLTTHQEILDAVLSAVRAVPRSGRFGSNKVFISEVYRRVGRQIGMTMDEFKRWLLIQNRNQNLDLARADTTSEMPPQKVEDSEIRDTRWGGQFHFIIDRSAPWV